jgi:nicotinate-nucleotide pyrophosphorylase (carboxylating)
MNDRDLLRIIRRALEEDLPDITTDSIFEPEERGRARVTVKAPGVIAGLATVPLTLDELDPEAEVELLATDGDEVTAGTIVATASATVRALLSGERTLLNILQRASGIATLTRAFVRAVEGTGAAILDTRKTLPGLRALDKYAVTAGGGENHRLGLHDMFLVKDNHVDRSGGIAEAIGKIRESGIERSLMVEVRSLDELRVALGHEPDFILLDNMPPTLMREAVALRDAHSGRKVLLEASGGITLETVRAVAESGIDRISIGALTHSAPALDISMKIEAL